MIIAEFDTTKSELFCLAAIQGFDSLLNVQYEPEETDADLIVLFNKLTEELRSKKWLEEDFDGNMTVSNEMAAAIELCAVAEQFWTVQSYVKKETTADYLYTVYNIDNVFLVLEQIDDDSFKGLLTADIGTVADAVFAKTPIVDAVPTYARILAPDLEEITEKEPYALINIAKYTTETEDGDRSLLCLDAAMFLLLDNCGSYILSVDNSEDGEFVPFMPTEDVKGFETIFVRGEGGS